MTATDYHAQDDRTLPLVVYALYLLGLVNGLTVLIGLVIAYANRERAGPAMESHYTFQIRTFWIAIAWWIIAGILFLWGIPLSLILVGVPLLVAGGLILAMTHIWFALRCILGLIYVSRGDAYPRPRTWLA
ncbi:MAG TPA: hypothetical protein VGM25_13920 [Caulobacteraceae bacterium]|jgi:uncharacterized membrane protein